MNHTNDVDAPPLSDRYLPDGWILPELNDENRPFFTSGRLMLQSCPSCGAVQHPAGEFCFDCQSLDLTHVEVPAVGEVIATTVVHHAVHPVLRAAVPYNAVVVELDGHPGIRIVGNVVDIAPADVTIGMRVEGTWARVSAPSESGDDETEYLLPQWRVIADGA